MRSIRTVLAGIALITLSGGAAFSPPGPTLKWIGEGGIIVGEGMATYEYGQPYLYGGMRLCLNRPGSVTVTNVRLENPSGGIRLEDHALYPRDGSSNTDLVGNGEPSTIQSKPLPERDPEVSQVCSPAASPIQRRSELVLQLSDRDDASGHTSAFLVDYTVGGRDRTLRIAIEYSFCGHRHDLPDLCLSHDQE